MTIKANVSGLARSLAANPIHRRPPSVKLKTVRLKRPSAKENEKSSGTMTPTSRLAFNNGIKLYGKSTLFSVSSSNYGMKTTISKVTRGRKRIDESLTQGFFVGCVLTLKLSCFANNVNVPKFWNTGATDAVGADILSVSQTEGIPQCLEFFLDNKMHIISKSPEFTPPNNDPTTALAPSFMQSPTMDSSFYSSIMMMMSDTAASTTFLNDIMNVPPAMTHPTPKHPDPAKRTYPPMPAADAINYIQQNNKGSYAQYIFMPSKFIGTPPPIASQLSSSLSFFLF